MPIYKFMYKLIFVFVLSCFACSLSAQRSQFAVEVGAFAERVPLSYFKKLNHKVYEALDVNEIYRYYIDVADEEKGQILRAEAKAAGYNYARVIDFEAQRQLCANQCGYTLPTPTDPANRLTPPRPTKKEKTTPEVENNGTISSIKKSELTPELKNNQAKKNEINTYETPQKQDRQGKIINIVDETQSPNSLKTNQANTQLNKNIGDKPIPAPKPKKKKIINNHYDK